MRGRLIFPFLAELHRLDADAMAAVDPDGAGPQQSGFDRDFREPILLDQDNDGVAEPWRREHPPIRVPCQVEPATVDAQRMSTAGNVPGLRIDLVFHVADLERLALIDRTSGEPLVRAGDRLEALHSADGVRSVGFGLPMFATELRASGFGLSLGRSRWNLLLVTFQSRMAARSLA